MTWTIELDRIAANYAYTSIGYAEVADLVDSFRAYARPHKLGHVALELRAARRGGRCDRRTTRARPR